MLDNAPTYLTFLTAAINMNGSVRNGGLLALTTQRDLVLVGISLGATLFGGLTYIGNGPNLLIKAIAEEAKVTAPQFFSFIGRYALPVLLPVLAIVALAALR